MSTPLMSDEFEEVHEVEEEPKKDTTVARSERYAVGISIATIGCASLFSWNAVITASSYYANRFCGSLIAKSFESVFSVTYQLTSLAATIYAARVTEEVSAAGRILPRLRGLVGLFAIFTLLACYPTAPRDEIFIPVTLIGVAICGGLSQALSAALYGISTAMPAEFMSYNMAGQAVGGLIPAAIEVVEELVVPPSSGSDDDDDDSCSNSKSFDVSAVAYFLAACALYVVAVTAFRVLERQPLFQSLIVRVADRRRQVSQSIDTRRAPPEPERLLADDTTDDEEVEIHDFGHLFRLTRIVAYPAASVFVVFTITLATFPTLTALARAKGHADDDDASGFRGLYVPLLFLEFNFADFLGRSHAYLFADSLGTRPRLLLGLAFARLLFLPFILLGTLQNSSLSGPSFIKATPTPFIVMFPYALSNGIIATLAMAAAGPLAPKSHKELVGNLMSIYLTAGLTAGSFLSFAMLALIES